MNTRKVKDAYDLNSNEKIYFRGHAKSTYMSNGKDVETTLNSKQDELISGFNIKTINEQSILGDGNINIMGGSSNLMLDFRLMGDPDSVDDEFGKLIFGKDKVIAGLKDISINDALSAMIGGEELVLVLALTVSGDDITYIRPSSQRYEYEGNKSVAEYSIDMYPYGLTKYILTLTSEGCEIIIMEQSQGSGGGDSYETPDWNASEDEAGYIKNKPFGFEDYVSKDIIVEAGGDFEREILRYSEEYGFWGNYDDLSDNPLVVLTKDGITIAEMQLAPNTSKVTEGDGDFYLRLEDNVLYVYGWSEKESETFKYYIGEPKQLNEAYIPDTIARKSDLENIGGSTGKSQFQIYQENGGTLYITEEQYNLYTSLKNDPEDITRNIYGPISKGDYTWENYGITPRIVAKWIYYNTYIKGDDYFYINITDMDLDEEEIEFKYISFDDGVIILDNDRNKTMSVYLDGNISIY